MGLPIGSQNATASGVVGVSGKSVRVYGIIVHSGASAGVVVLRNGTGTGDTEYDEITGIANESERINYNGGLHFPDGCYLHETTAPDYSTVIFEQETI